MSGPDSRFTVTCPDGTVRHVDPFATLEAAELFAEWGHACRRRHEIHEHQDGELVRVWQDSSLVFEEGNDNL